MAIHVAPLALSEIVEISAATSGKTAADKGVELRCEVEAGVPDRIIGDARRISQILINLIGNAVKFTDSGSVVLRVSRSGQGAWASRPCEAQGFAAMPISKRTGRPFSLEEESPPTVSGGSFLDFSVEDTGVGISARALARLFAPFTQADPTTSRRFGGTGLGLAITKRLAEAMGGSITVTSIPEKGSTFTFRLPLEIPPSKNGDVILPLCWEEPSVGTPLPRAPVLVVDDAPTSRVLAGKMLQGLGYRVEFADNGEKALQAFLPGKFSAILMDMAMPVMDGLECTVRIREIEAAAGSRVPIIASTANVLPDDREKCLAAGMDDFLSKPFKRAELTAKLASVVRR
jgi:CheY-like chemotaxis protein